LRTILPIEANARNADEALGRTVEGERNRSLGAYDVSELRQHEGGGSREIGCFRDGGEKLG
jgi:hypothetical protein